MKKPINTIDPEAVTQFKFLNEHSGEFNALDRYQEIATQSAIYPGQGTPFGLMYAALGLAEAGEVQNKVKKTFRDDGVIEFQSLNPGGGYVNFSPLSAERKAQIVAELGGALWYIAAVCNEIGATMSEVALHNLEELCSRGQRGTLGGDGDNR
jgi:NTP pyrophosphatase (non-canonical NTP hydrolase)